MVTAIVVSGGSGSRAGQAVPKQYLTVNEIPVIAYTLMNLQKVPEIDKIVVVAAEGWGNFIYAYATQFGVTKFSEVVLGGTTRNESIYNGLRALAGDGGTEKVCLVDANRPLVPLEVINNVIKLADKCDCAMVMEPCYDSMFWSENGVTVEQNAPRTKLFKQAGPECASLETLLALYEDDNTRNIKELSTAGLAVSRGKKVLAAKGHIKCFKITTADDFELFKAFLAAEPLYDIVRRVEK